MLPSAHRLRRSSDFAATVRAGRRARRGSLVVHHLAAVPSPDAGPDASPSPARVGFVVSRAVGTSVVRHRVTRRLRHVVRGRLAELPSASTTVVRALPSAAEADSAQLDADLVAALGRIAGGTR